MKSEIAKLVMRIVAISLAIAALMAGAALVMGKDGAALSIGAGAAIASASFAVLAWTIAGSLQGQARGMRAGLMVGLGLLKLIAIGAILWWLITRAYVEPITFLAGFTTLVAALVVEGLRAARRGAKANS